MIVALHGFTGAPSVWRDFPVRALPLLGHGASSSSESFDDEVERLCGELPDEPVHLVGYSMGARLALAMALRCPARIRELTLIAGSPGIEEEPERAARLEWEGELRRTLLESGIDDFVDQWESLPMWKTQQSAAPERLARQRELRLSHEPAGLARSLEVLGTGRMPNLWPRLGELPMPVTLVVGSRDDKYRALARRMLEKLPEATLELIEDCGHNPLIEAPEALRRVVCPGQESASP